MEDARHTQAIRLLHRGRLDEAETLLMSLRDAPLGYGDVILIEVLMAQGKRAAAAAVYERLLWSSWLDTVPDMRAKLQRSLPQFLRVWSPRAYDLHPMEAIPDGTTLVGGSLCVHAGALGVVARALNVVYDGKELKQSGDRWKRYINTLYWCVLDPSLRMLSSTRLVDKAVFPRANDAFVGYEDPRVVVWEGERWMTSTSYQVYRSGKAHIVLSRLGNDHVASAIPLQCPDMNDDQRHWCPWVHQGALHFLYKVQPWTVLRLDQVDTGATSVVVQRPMHGWRDGLFPATSPVPYKKGYLAIIGYHDTPRSHEERTLYRYVRLNAALIPTHWSSTWVLWEPELETIQGMVIHGAYVYVTYGHRQKECRVTRFILPLLETALTWTPLTT